MAITRRKTVGIESIIIEGSAEVELAEIGDGTVQTTINGVISDGGGGIGLTKSGDKALIVTGLNTYGGPTVIQQNNIQLGVNGRSRSNVWASRRYSAAASLDWSKRWPMNSRPMVSASTI